MGSMGSMSITSNGGLASEVKRVIYDHCSVSWTGGNGFFIADNGFNTITPVRDITVQNCLFAETLFYYRFGSHLRSNPDQPQPWPGATGWVAGRDQGNIDMLRNMFTSYAGRNPLISGMSDPLRYVNNIFYNSEGAFMTIRAYNEHRNRPVDLINNRFDWGNVVPNDPGWAFVPIIIARYDANPPSVHVSGNYDHDRKGYDQAGMCLLMGNGDYDSATNAAGRPHQEGAPLPANFLRSTPAPLPAGATPYTLHHVDDMPAAILPLIGASQRVDAAGNWVSNRDAVDARIVDDHFWAREPVFLPYHEDEVGGYPTLTGGAAPTDTSGDGIPDTWLVNNSLDPAVAIGSQIHESGYSYLELYLNGIPLI